MVYTTGYLDQCGKHPREREHCCWIEEYLGARWVETGPQIPPNGFGWFAISPRNWPVCLKGQPPISVLLLAFTINWHTLNSYAFPPFSIMAAVLKKIQIDKGEGACVLPNWPTQSWYPKAMKMILISHPVDLKPWKDLLTLPSDPNQCHPLRAWLHLLVCHLSRNN